MNTKSFLFLSVVEAVSLTEDRLFHFDNKSSSSMVVIFVQWDSKGNRN
jgi:hypothetical protein